MRLDAIDLLFRSGLIILWLIFSTSQALSADSVQVEREYCGPEIVTSGVL